MMEGEDGGNISIGYHECSITTLSRANLRHMWASASGILDEHEAVLREPWDKKAHSGLSSMAKLLHPARFKSRKLVDQVLVPVV